MKCLKPDCGAKYVVRVSSKDQSFQTYSPHPSSSWSTKKRRMFTRNDRYGGPTMTKTPSAIRLRDTFKEFLRILVTSRSHTLPFSNRKVLKHTFP